MNPFNVIEGDALERLRELPAEMARERSRGVQNAFRFFGGPPR